jgi:hypothetical protein
MPSDAYKTAELTPAIIRNRKARVKLIAPRHAP